MKVTALEIKRTASYEDPPNELRGIVTMTGPTGQQTVVLTPCAICAIFETIIAEVQETAQANAKQAKAALTNAQAEQHILTHEVD